LTAALSQWFYFVELLETTNDNCSSTGGTPCFIRIRSGRILVRHETAEVGQMRHGAGDAEVLYFLFFFFTEEYPWSFSTHQTGFCGEADANIFVGC
jgi:hypothetical protein